MYNFYKNTTKELIVLIKYQQNKNNIKQKKTFLHISNPINVFLLKKFYICKIFNYITYYDKQQ